MKYELALKFLATVATGKEVKHSSKQPLNLALIGNILAQCIVGDLCQTRITNGGSDPIEKIFRASTLQK